MNHWIKQVLFRDSGHKFIDFDANRVRACLCMCAFFPFLAAFEMKHFEEFEFIRVKDFIYWRMPVKYNTSFTYFQS